MTVKRRRRGAWLLLLGAAIVVVLAGCADNAPQDYLDPAGPQAEKIDGLFKPVLYVAAAIFVLVEGAIIFAAFRYRRRGAADTAVPPQIHGNTRLEVGWTILPAVILAAVSVPTVAAIFDLTDRPEGAMQVNVTGQQFWWAYEYPGFELEDGSGPVVTANELHIPAGRPVHLELRSEDVIHSFWAPRLIGKRDVVPGRLHTWWIEADEPGTYLGQCVEFCGISHANMRLKVVAHDEADWEAWIEDQQRLPDAPRSGDATEGATVFDQTCASCHVVNGQFERVQQGSPPAPNLTHLFDRECFAGCIFDLDRNELEAWLRDPQRKDGSLMVIPELSEEQIDSLVAYLETLQ
jgi:cytochrome c oxidase subunit 2